jgi:WD40 repeat protein
MILIAIGFGAAGPAALLAGAQEIEADDRLISPDGELALSAEGRALSLWDVASGRLLMRLSVDSDIAFFGFTPDGAQVFAVGSDGKRRLWDVRTGRLLSPSG